MSQGHFLAVHSSHGIFVILVEQLDMPVHSRASAVKQLVKQLVKQSVKQPVKQLAKQLLSLNNSICQFLPAQGTRQISVRPHTLVA